MAIAGVRRRHVEEEGESVFVSMTDLTVSFLFVILILLAFFATQFKPEETVPRVEYDALEVELSEARNKIRSLEEALAAARRKIEVLEEERRNLHTRLTERGRTITALRERVSVLRDMLAAADTRVRDLSTRIEQLEGDLEHVRVERDDARERIKSLMDEVDRLSVTVDDLQREVSRLQDRIAELGKPDPLAAYLEEVSSARSILLERLAERIRRQLPGIQVTVVAADGVIRFRGDDLFKSGRWRIRPGSTADRVSRAVGDALADTLPCYTVGSRAAFKASCNGTFTAIETIQIEGHTDSVPLSGPLREREKMLDNRDLSARRGAETLRAAADRYRPELMEFLNLHGQPVLSFAGYGAMRPIDPRDTEEARAANRRIDIRFILQTPQNLREVEEIRGRLTQNRPNLPPVVDGNTP